MTAQLKIRLRSSTVAVVKGVMLCSFEEEEHEGSTIQRLQRFVNDRVLVKGWLTLPYDEGVLLQRLVLEGAPKVFAEGSNLHREALHFAAALGDLIVSRPPAPVEEKSEPTEEEIARAAHIAAAQQAERQQAQLRDEMLRQVFTGGPRKSINIWGQVVEEPAPLTKEEMWAKSKTTSPADWHKVAEWDRQDAVRRMGAAMKYESSTRVRLHAKPTADVEADQILTDGKPMTFNEDMKREGAQELLAQQQKTVACRYNREDGRVVGTISDFIKKTYG
jgi:hypothetical protein